MTLLKRWINAQKEELLSWVKISMKNKSPEKTRWEEFMREFDHFIPSIATSSVIFDLGCGPDGLIFHIPKQGLKIGLDPLIDSYSIHYDISEGVSLVKGVGEYLPFRDNCLDFVFCINTLDHTINPRKVLKSLWKTLKTGGLLLLDVNTEPLLDILFMKLGYRPPLDEYHPHKLLPNEVIRNLREVGFEIHRMRLERPMPHHIILGAVSKIKSFFVNSDISDQEIYDISNIQWLEFVIIRILDMIMYPIIKRYFSGEIVVLAVKV